MTKDIDTEESQYECKRNYLLKKQKKNVETVFIESVKVDLNGFPYKYIKNIAFK